MLQGDEGENAPEELTTSKYNKIAGYGGALLTGDAETRTNASIFYSASMAYVTYCIASNITHRHPWDEGGVFLHSKRGDRNEKVVAKRIARR